MTKQITELFYRFFNLIYRKNFSIYRWLYFTYKNVMDKREIDLMKRIIKPGMTVVDVGANIGFYTKLSADLVGEKGMVHAFEPEYHNHRHLVKMCRGRHNIKINRYAVGTKSGSINLFISKELNVDHLAYDDGGARRKVKVLSISLDKYFGGKGKVDFIKIDTQGYEYQVLRGMKKLIQNSTSMVIMTEFSAYDLSLAGTHPEKLLKLAKNLGLKIRILGKKFGFTDKRGLLIKNPNRAVYYNLLYVKGNQRINF